MDISQRHVLIKLTSFPLWQKLKSLLISEVYCLLSFKPASMRVEYIPVALSRWISHIISIPFTAKSAALQQQLRPRAILQSASIYPRKPASMGKSHWFQGLRKKSEYFTVLLNMVDSGVVEQRHRLTETLLSPLQPLAQQRWTCCMGWCTIFIFGQCVKMNKTKQEKENQAVNKQ